MIVGSPPVKTSVAWAANAAGAYIRVVPIASQIGIQDGAASYNDGFPPDNFVPTTGGGVPPFGQDMNGVLNEITIWLQWMQAGAPTFYDSAFAAAVGGYPRGAKLPSAILPGLVWYSTADNNSTDPDSVSSANWIQDQGQVQTGTPVPSLFAAAPSGYVTSNTLTIGNATSNATNLAAPTTIFLFRKLWALSPTICPIFTSAGALSTRGANADADFAANKAIATPDMAGAGLIGVDTMGGPATTRLSGAPIVVGSTTTPASILGENLHALALAENGPHSHSNSLNDPTHQHGFVAYQNNAGAAAGITTGGVAQPVSLLGSNTLANATGMTITNASSGSGTGHNTVERNTTVYWNLKL